MEYYINIGNNKRLVKGIIVKIKSTPETIYLVVKV